MTHTTPSAPPFSVIHYPDMDWVRFWQYGRKETDGYLGLATDLAPRFARMLASAAALPPHAECLLMFPPAGLFVRLDGTGTAIIGFMRQRPSKPGEEPRDPLVDLIHAPAASLAQGAVALQSPDSLSAHQVASALSEGQRDAQALTAILSAPPCALPRAQA